MMRNQMQKIVGITPPAAISDNATLTTAELDCQGFRYLTIYAYVGATDIAMVTLKVTESDTAGSNHADVTGLVFGTSTNIDGSTSAVPSATDDNKFFAFDIDLRGRKRYIDVTAVTGDGSTGAYVTLFGIFDRGETVPTSAAERGCDEILRV